MYITESDYKVIKKALNLVNYNELTDEEVNIINLAHNVLTISHLKQKEINKITTKKIMEKRKTDKTYCHK